MVRQVSSKRMRVYSPEAKTLLGLSFARNYVNHLVPALRNRTVANVAERTSSTTTINASTNDDIRNPHEVVKSVRFDVDMALALSAKGFRWSHALEAKLQRGQALSINAAIPHSLRSNSKTEAIVENEVFTSPVSILSSNNSAFRNPKCDLKVTKKLSSPRSRRLGSRKLLRPKRSEEDEASDKLARLMTLLPGASAIKGNEDEFLVEIASYITCLKLQVKVLQCLVEGDE